MKRTSWLYLDTMKWWRMNVLADLGEKCILCSNGSNMYHPIEVHHIFFRSQDDYRYLFDPDFGVPIDCVCHKEQPFSPHGPQANNKLFLQMLKEKLDPERWAKIQKHLDKPYTPPALSLTREMLKSIRADLKKRFKEITKDSWMDADIEPEYRGRRA